MQPTAPRHHLQTTLRIAVVTETYPPEINGVARTIGVTVDGLLERGHQIELIRPRQADDRRRPQANPRNGLHEQLTLGFPIPGYPELQFGITRIGPLVRAWRAQRPDVVHLITEGPLGWSALVAARKLGIPVVSDFHTNFHDYSRYYGCGLASGLVEGYLRALHNRTQRTFVPTREMHDRLLASHFNGLAIVGRGVDAQLFSPAKRSAELRRSWQCKDDTPVALYVGRLAREKNLRLFVDSVRAASSYRRDLRVVVVGDGPMGRRLRSDNPDFHFAGMRSGEDLAAHYASADLFVFPSLSETFGNVTMEALASGLGLAVIAFDCAAAHEHIVHGHNGLVANCGDEIAFRSHTLRVAGASHEALKMRARASQSVECLSWSNSVDALERSLIECAGTSQCATPESVPIAAATD